MTLTVVDTDPKIRTGMDEQPHSKNLVILFAESVDPALPGGADNDDVAGEANGQHNDLAADVIRKNHGQVIRTIGTSVMAEFADPAAAVRAAVDMERILIESHQEFSHRDQPGLRIGIYGLIGNCRRLDIFGGLVQRAASITKHASSGQILASREVCDALSKETDLHFQWYRKVTLDGQTDNEDIFEVRWSKNTAEMPSRYECPLQVGTGGMGIVYKTRDRETGDIVALKVLRSEIATDPAMQENLRREVCLARKITHKNVCRIHEFNRSNGMAYISMEFVEGASLLSTLERGGPLSWDQAVKIAWQVCAGLGEAHAQGIVHRDLKPANIMMDLSGIAKIMDFGIARPFQSTSQMTGALMGTPAYMAPEQVEMSGVDARTDIYAVGLLLYEMVTGFQAFGGDTPIAVAVKQLREIPKRPREIVPTLPVHAEAVIMKCIQKDPNKRFQSMAELAAALKSNVKATPRASLSSSFVTDMRHFGQALHRDLQPQVNAVEQFFRRQDWSFLTNKKPQRVLTALIGAGCLLCGMAFVRFESVRKHAAINSASSNGTSVGIAIQNLQPSIPNTIRAVEGSTPAADETHQSTDGSSAADASQPFMTHGVNFGSDSKSGSGSGRTQSLPVLRSSEQSAKFKRTGIIQDEKKHPLSGTSSPALAERRVAPLPVAIQTKPMQPPAGASSTSAMSTSGSKEQKTANTPSVISAIALPITPRATPEEAKVEAKTSDDNTALPFRYFAVGSFKESAWADDAVEKLNKLGFHAVSIHKNVLWVQSYQVQVGPYTDAKDLETARQDLVSQGFKPHPVK